MQETISFAQHLIFGVHPPFFGTGYRLCTPLIFGVHPSSLMPVTDCVHPSSIVLATDCVHPSSLVLATDCVYPSSLVLDTDYVHPSSLVYIPYLWCWLQTVYTPHLEGTLAPCGPLVFYELGLCNVLFEVTRKRATESLQHTPTTAKCSLTS